MAVKIPEKTCIEWQQMITGEIEHKYENYAVRTKIHTLKKDVKAGRISIEDAVNDLYELCLKYSNSIENDIKVIFKNHFE